MAIATKELSKRAVALSAFMDSGQPLREVIAEHVKTDRDARALKELGLTVYGTRIREACKCWFYERNPWQHDCFLDLPDLPITVAAPLLIRLTFLDGHQGTFDPEPLFHVPEEFTTFVRIHDTDIGWNTAALMGRLAEQARWGRHHGVKMAMIHNVPGLDPDYVPSSESQAELLAARTKVSA